MLFHVECVAVGDVLGDREYPVLDHGGAVGDEQVVPLGVDLLDEYVVLQLDVGAEYFLFDDLLPPGLLVLLVNLLGPRSD